MSGGLKKIVKVATLGASDKLLGDSAAEAARRNARQQAQQAQEQARQLAESARASALAQQSDIDRQRALASAQESLQSSEQEAPTVDLSTGVSEATTRRKRFQTQSVGGTGSGGVSLRV